MAETAKRERTRVFAVYLTEREMQALQSAANEKGMTKSAFFRLFLLPLAKTVKEDAEF